MTAAEAEMAAPEAKPRARGGNPGGQGRLLKTLAVAASVALVAGPAFTFHRAARLHLPAPPAAASIAVGAAAVTLEPLLPSGLF
jgi:hypothetical protein